uniref:Uncharacterized protein n=1 Tax=Anguilla anguilla TaxID=7936 RepID=A0A0E9SQR8_ANGAN
MIYKNSSLSRVLLILFEVLIGNFLCVIKELFDTSRRFWQAAGLQ